MATEVDEVDAGLADAIERWATRAELAEQRATLRGDAYAGLLTQALQAARSAEWYRQRCVEQAAEIKRLRDGRRRDGRALREVLALWSRIGQALPELAIEQGWHVRLAEHAADADAGGD